MALPLFFHDGTLQQFAEIQLDEDTARHVIQVLRMQAGGKLELTDGKGGLAVARIERAEKRKCHVIIDHVDFHAPGKTKLHLCVAFTKNTSRNEWLLEKATELGAGSIIPLIAARTERERIRYDRWRNILIAALIQSQQYYLPELPDAMQVKEILQRFNGAEQKLIGHCISSEKRLPLSEAMKEGRETVILIGPEGDFTNEEVQLCLEAGFTGIDMGNRRLRTETAAIAACAYFNLINHEV